MKSNRSQHEAEIRAAVFNAVAKFGYSETVRIIEEVRREVDNNEWKGPGNR
tara:strand:+ start:351 stop:503 length:153 start_codon:yes stop_codon:yes gene_type:complete